MAASARFVLIVGAVLLALVGVWLWHNRQSTPPTPAASSVPTPAEQAPALVPSLATSRLVLARPADPAAAPLVKEETFTSNVPPAYAAFDRWVKKYVAASPADRPALLAEGRRLVEARAAILPDFIRSNPEAAILFTPPPAIRAILPPEILARMETILSEEGFFGVKAVCNHDPGQPHDGSCRIEREIVRDARATPAAIYGSRFNRKTEPQASLYGVEFDGVVALHEDDIVLLPGSDIAADHVGDTAVIYKGRTTFASDANSLQEVVRTLTTP